MKITIDDMDTAGNKCQVEFSEETPTWMQCLEYFCYALKGMGYQIDFSGEELAEAISFLRSSKSDD